MKRRINVCSIRLFLKDKVTHKKRTFRDYVLSLTPIESLVMFPARPQQRKQPNSNVVPPHLSAQIYSFDSAHFTPQLAELLEGVSHRADPRRTTEESPPTKSPR